MTRIGVRCCPRVVFWPRTVSYPGLRIGPNRLYRLAPFVQAGRNAALSPMDDDPMINDAGKHQVNDEGLPVSLRAGLRYFQDVPTSLRHVPCPFFTSPLEGEVARRSFSEGEREGGKPQAPLRLTPSLTLPHKGGGNRLSVGGRERAETAASPHKSQVMNANL